MLLSRRLVYVPFSTSLLPSAATTLNIKPHNKRYNSTIIHIVSNETGDANNNNKTTEEQTSTFTDPRSSILEGALPHVHKLGWTIDALSASAREQGLPSISHGLFPNGGYDLVDYFVTKCDRAMAEELYAKAEELKAMRVRDRIQTAIKIRLSLVTPYKNSWSQAMALLAKPPHTPNSLHRLAVMVDEMWFHAGDKSTDINWYTKRGMLATVYTTSELYLLSDSSQGFRDTWQFVERRIDDIMTISKAKYELEKSASSLFDTICHFASTATKRP